MILISASPSPFARKVRISLLEKGVDFELRNEIPWHADTQTPRYNPLEQLPILIPDDGDPVFESTYIMDWLEYKYPEPTMLPDDAEGQMEAKLIQVIAEGVVDATVQIFWEVQREHPSANWIQRQLRKIRGGLADLNRRVASREYVVGDRFGLGDIAIIAMLGSQDTIDKNGMAPVLKAYDPEFVSWRANCPNLVAYEARHRDRPSVKSTSPFMFELSEKIV